MFLYCFLANSSSEPFNHLHPPIFLVIAILYFKQFPTLRHRQTLIFLFIRFFSFPSNIMSFIVYQQTRNCFEVYNRWKKIISQDLLHFYFHRPEIHIFNLPHLIAISLVSNPRSFLFVCNFSCPSLSNPCYTVIHVSGMWAIQQNPIFSRWYPWFFHFMTIHLTYIFSFVIVMKRVKRFAGQLRLIDRSVWCGVSFIHSLSTRDLKGTSQILTVCFDKNYFNSHQNSLCED